MNERTTPETPNDSVDKPSVGTLLSVNVGMPADVAWRGRTVRSGLDKRPVSGPVMVHRLNVDGDGQGDTAGHGGEQRAVLVYQVESYRHWERHFGVTDLEYGTFSENFTVAGLSDDQVCIGDRYRIGPAVFEVTQPRVTCFRAGIRLGQPSLAALLVDHHRPGFYLRVIDEGHVRAGDRIELVHRGPRSVTVAEADALLYLPDPPIDRVRDAAGISALSPGWRRSFDDLLDSHDRADPSAVRHSDAPAWPGFRPMRVTTLTHETDDVLSIALAPVDGDELPTPRAGQYITVQLEAAGFPPPVRSYSLSSSPGSRTYRISVKRQIDGQVSTWLHDHLEPGALIQAAAPRGTFTLDTTADNPVVLISAGIGATPVLSMLHALAAVGSHRAVWWLHTAPDASRHAFAQEASRLLAQLPDSHSLVFYTRATSPEPGIVVGRITRATLARLDLPGNATVYTCGPSPFMDTVAASCTSLGISDVRSELFGTLSAINPGIVGEAPMHHPHLPDGPPGTGPMITFARSGLSAPWSAQRSTLLDFAEACDVPTRWSCRTGVCHICSTQMLSGAVNYLSAPLVPPPAGQVLLCSSEPSEPLVLDM